MMLFQMYLTSSFISYIQERESLMQLFGELSGSSIMDVILSCRWPLI